MIKRLVVASLLVLVLLLIGALVQRTFFNDEPTASMSQSTEASLPSDGGTDTTIFVTKVTGTVERKGNDGVWQPVAVGDVLAANDWVRTSGDSTATLNLGADVQLHIADTTEIRIAEVSRTLARIGLANGRLASEVPIGRGRHLTVQIRGTDTIAETRGGKLAVMHRGNGIVAVAAEEGSATVTAQQRTVELKTGQQALVPRGQPPTPPTDIPPSLYLKLSELPGQVPPGQKVTLRGKTLPGAVVSIDGVVSTHSDESGSFAHTLVLQDGKNEIVVSVEDVLGRRDRQKLPPLKVTPAAKGKPKSAGSDAGLEGKVVW